MDNNKPGLTKEEKENVLLVLNEFSGDYKKNTKAVSELAALIEEYMDKINTLLQSENGQAIAGDIENLREMLRAFLEEKLQPLSQKLDKHSALLQHPVRQQVVHHHHVTKITWIAAGLFLALALACCGWYMTGKKLNDFRANDTKYRYLKLLENQSLRRLLYQTDSIYQIQSGLRDSVISKEEEIKHKLEMLQQASDKEQEAKELRKKAKGK